MKILKTNISDLLILSPDVFTDERGWFLESYNSEIFSKNNLKYTFVQDNHSFSKIKGVLRGLHFQNYPKTQAKLVRCTKGRIWDVAVDLRLSSSTYLSWFGIELSEKNKLMLLIPHGFAHGFVTLDDDCEIQYKVDNYYDKHLDRSIKYDDPQINISWPIKDLILSEKDKNAPFLKDTDVIFR